MLHSGGQNQRWPTSGPGGYITLAVWGDPRCCRAGDKIRSGPQVGRVATQPLPSGGVPNAAERGTKSELAHKWAQWLHNPCRLGGPQCFRAGDKIRSGPELAQKNLKPSSFFGGGGFWNLIKTKVVFSRFCNRVKKTFFF